MFTDLENKITKLISEYRLSSEVTLVYYIAQKLHVLEYVRYILSRTSDNELDCFHNKTHLISVALNCYEGSIHHKLNYNEKRSVFVAGLFHDYNHSLGILPDSGNILNSKKALITLSESIVSDYDTVKLSEDELLASLECIDCTLHGSQEDCQNTLESIIRDSDRMGLYEPESTAIRLYRGLLEEIRASRKLNGNHTFYTAADFIIQQDQYLKEIQWSSKWAIDKANIRDWDTLRCKLKLSLFNQLK